MRWLSCVLWIARDGQVEMERNGCVTALKQDPSHGAAEVVVKKRESGRCRCLTQGGSGDDKRKVPGTKKKKIRNYCWNRTNSSPGTEGRGNSKMPPIPTKNEQNFNGVNAVKRRD